ncbi:MAG: hypothetical protein EXS67_02170 [Candidatus Margulisbacteria bacterium]|nr:hypothetical protein [Candidatus Margulisiibacteriota bacterium]
MLPETKYANRSDFTTKSKSYVAGVGNYGPCILTPENSSEYSSVGCVDLADCVGLIMHDPISKTTAFWHCNEFTPGRTLPPLLTFILLSLRASDSGSPFIPQLEKKLEELNKMVSIDVLSYAPKPEDFELLLATGNICTRATGALASTQTRNLDPMSQLLSKIFRQVSVDRNTSQILIDRQSGKLLKDFSVSEGTVTI